MNVGELLGQAGEYLKQRNVEDPSKEAGLLLSWVLNRSLGSIYAHQELVPEDEQIKAFRSFVERRGLHEPFAYITGECEFMSLSFRVSPNVLIPRPDTEILAEAALTAIGQGSGFLPKDVFMLPKTDSYRVLDIGTGTGCLAISIAKYAPSVKADAVDISESALDIARANAERHHVEGKVHFIHADFLSNKTVFNDRYDLVVSNPPYIPARDIAGLMASVRDYEPHTALEGGDDGLLFYHALAEKSSNLLTDQGILAVECGFDQAAQIRELFLKQGMKTLILRDLSGIDRVVMGKRQ